MLKYGVSEINQSRTNNFIQFLGILIVILKTHKEIAKSHQYTRISSTITRLKYSLC